MQVSRRKSTEIEADGEIQKMPLSALAVAPFPVTVSVKKERIEGKRFIIVVTVILLSFAQVTSNIVWDNGALK